VIEPTFGICLNVGFGAPPVMQEEKEKEIEVNNL